MANQSTILLAIHHFSRASIWFQSSMLQLLRFILLGSMQPRDVLIFHYHIWGIQLSRILRHGEKHLSASCWDRLLRHILNCTLFLFLAPIAHGMGHNPEITSLEVLFFNLLPNSLDYLSWASSPFLPISLVTMWTITPGCSPSPPMVEFFFKAQSIRYNEVFLHCILTEHGILWRNLVSLPKAE